MENKILSTPLKGSSQPVQQSASAVRSVQWPQVAAFLGLSFGLAWLIDLVLYLNGGLANPSTKLLLQFQMLMPAFSALLLGMFFFKDSPIYYRTLRTAARWFIYFYFLLTFLYLVGSVVSLILPVEATGISAVLLILSALGLILLIVLRLVGGKNTYPSVGMAGGKAIWWLVFGVGLVAFYGLMSYLNYVFKLGTLADITNLFPAAVINTAPAPVLLLEAGINAVLIGPFLGLIITFGEEYGWRGYLQGELTRLGRKKGVLLLGLIWGVWHWPIIWMGYNYPGQPVIGSLMMVGYCVVLAYLLAYAVYKSKGLWTAVYLHAINNQSLSYFMLALVTPTNLVLSFGIGLPGLALAAVVIGLILRDPLWNES